MKKLIYLFALIPITFSCGGEEETTEETTTDTPETVVEEVEEVVNSFVINPNVVGIFELGQSVPENLPEELSMRQFVEEETHEGVTEEHTHNVIFNQLEDVVELIMDQGSGEHHEDKAISEMWVLSDYYETNEGVGVGSTIEEFMEAYPDATFWYATESDQYLMETESLLGAQFILNAKDVIKPARGKSDMEKMSMGAFAEGATIQKIRMY